MTLPVARCGDCLYWDCVSWAEDDEQMEGACNIRSSVPLYKYARNWCGEFIHRVLGAQYLQNGLETGPAYHKQWRFPTEPE